MAPASALRWMARTRLRKSVSTSLPRPSSSTLLRHPHPGNKWQGFPARPPPHSPFPRETARSSAISSPNTATAESPAPSPACSCKKSPGPPAQEKTLRHSNGSFSTQIPPTPNSSTIGKHSNPRNAHQPLVRGHKRQIIYLRRSHQKSIRRIAMPQHREPELMRYFPVQRDLDQT